MKEGWEGRGKGVAARQREKPAKALMVMPPRAAAARPVDAVTKVESLGKARRMCFRSSDLPVPAEPVKKTLCPSLQWRSKLNSTPKVMTKTSSQVVTSHYCGEYISCSGQ